MKLQTAVLFKLLDNKQRENVESFKEDLSKKERGIDLSKLYSRHLLPQEVHQARMLEQVPSIQAAASFLSLPFMGRSLGLELPKAILEDMALVLSTIESSKACVSRFNFYKDLKFKPLANELSFLQRLRKALC